MSTAAGKKEALVLAMKRGEDDDKVGASGCSCGLWRGA